MPILSRGPEQQATPSEYELAAGEALRPESVTATFDGSAAAAAFLPCLSIYAKSGELLARSPAPEVAAGDTAEVTFAPLLRAAAAAAGVAWLGSFAVVSATGSVGVGLSASPDLSAFDTNDSGTFEQDSAGAAGHSGGIFAKAVGRFVVIARADFVDPAGGPVEPAASQMSCTWESYNLTGSESDFHINQATQTGYPEFPTSPFGAALHWNPWNLGMWDIGAAFVGPPYSEWHLTVSNNGTQTMNYTAALLVFRLGVSSGL